MELGERIRLAREAQRISQAEIARTLKISRNSVSQWEAGTTTPDPKRLQPIADALGVDVNWLLTGNGKGPEMQTPAVTERRPSPLIITAPTTSAVTDFPIYAAAEGGEGHLIVSFEPIDFIQRPAPLANVRGAYGLLIVGESMAPAFRPGDIALVHPHLPIAGDADVILYHLPPHDQAEAMIKHVVSWSEQEYTLEQYKPPKRFKELRSDWPVCHRVIGKFSRR